MHPIQQQGRRIPSLSSEITLATCSFLVFDNFGAIVQQIHSFLASGVRPSHKVYAFLSRISASRKSEGSWCATPPEMFEAMNVL